MEGHPPSIETYVRRLEFKVFVALLTAVVAIHVMAPRIVTAVGWERFRSAVELLRRAWSKFAIESQALESVNSHFFLSYCIVQIAMPLASVALATILLPIVWKRVRHLSDQRFQWTPIGLPFMVVGFPLLLYLMHFVAVDFTKGKFANLYFQILWMSLIYNALLSGCMRLSLAVLNHLRRYRAQAQ